MSRELALRASRLALIAFVALFVEVSCLQPLAAQDADLDASAAAAISAKPAEAPAPAATAAAPGAADTAAAATEEPKPEPLAWDLLHRRYSTWFGPTGGLFLVDASNGEVGALRLQLGLDLFSGNNVLLKGDHLEQDQQTLALSWTATKIFEVYASMLNRSTAISKPAAQSLSSLGDISLGGKIGGRIAPLFYLAGDLRAAFANEVGGGGSTLGATNLGLRGELSAHLEELEQPVPLIVRFNMGYLFDNSSQLVTDIEDARYASINGIKNKQSNETRQLVSRFERLAMGVNRLDRFSLGLGLEVPLEVTDRFFLHPLLEWRIDVPVNRSGYNCPFVKANKASGTLSTSQDSCYERTSGDSFPMNLALGVRAVPPIRGVSLTLAADFGLVGTSKFVRELAPNLPYRLMLALSYDYDARPPPPPIVVEAKPTEPPPAPTGRIQGIVTSSEGGPIAGAIVTFLDHDVSAVASSSDGHFISEPFIAGEVRMEASQPDYEPGQCVALIPVPGGNVEAQCMLTPKPRIGTLRGRVTDVWGSPVSGARIELSGASIISATSDVRGAFEAANLQPGEYAVKAQADGFFMRLTKTAVEARAISTFDVTLMQKPLEPTITVSGKNITAKNIKFQGSATELDDAGAASVAELADLMLTRTELNVRIQGYGDDAVALSRALLIKQRLVDAGVPEGRVEAVGGGKKRITISVNP